MGSNALVGDISQFYLTVNLIPKHWRFQCILLRENLDPNGQLLEAVIIKLAFGVSSISAQTEEVVRRLAVRLKEEFPEVCDLLLKSCYVDDLAKSTSTSAHSGALATETSHLLLKNLGMVVKGWTVVGSKPPDDVTRDGETIVFPGLVWYSEMDVFKLNIPPLYIRKKETREDTGHC